MSNQIWIENDTENGVLRLFNAEGVVVGLYAEELAALREYFQQERDQQLGVWRDPEAQKYVCYPHGDDGVTILHEDTGVGTVHARDAAHSENSIVGRYFAAHPKEEPKPWLDAKPGETWNVTYEDESDMPAFRVSEDHEAHPWMTAQGVWLGDDEIASATRIYPPTKDSK